MLFRVSTPKETEDAKVCLPHIVLTVGRVVYKCLMECYYLLDWTTGLEYWTGLTHFCVNSSNKLIPAIKLYCTLITWQSQSAKNTINGSDSFGECAQTPSTLTQPN